MAKTKIEKLNEIKGVQIRPKGKSWVVRIGKSVTKGKAIDIQRKSKSEAIGYVENQLQFRANRTSDLQKLTDAQISDARRALDLLSKLDSDKTLTSVVEFWTSKQPKFDPWTVNEACDSYMMNRTKNRDKPISKEWTRQLELCFKSFRLDFGEEMIHEITENDIEEYMEDHHGENAPKTYKNNMIQIKALFNHAQTRKKIVENPTENFTITKDTMNKPEILSPHDLHILIETAKNEAPEIVIPWALQAFAGLRASETSRLKWGDLKDVDLVIEKSIAKTGRRRTPPILTPLKNLLAWAESDSKPKDKNILPYSLRKWNKKRVQIMTKATISMPKNCLRHSFVSYRLADIQNSAQVALEAGHTEQILHENYNSNVSKSEAVTYWKLYSNNSVPLPKKSVAS